MSIAYPLLGLHPVTRMDFVRFWERLYSSRYDEAFYQEHIGQPLSDEGIVIRWFEWKNGKRLSAKKAETVRRHFLPDTERIGHDADPEAPTAYPNRPGGAIWRIFWLHLQHPHYFPIYD